MNEFISRRQMRETQERRQSDSRRRFNLSPRVILIGAVLLVAVLVIGTAVWWQQNDHQPAAMSIDGPLEDVSVQGRTGSAPVVTVERPIEMAVAKNRKVIVGTGREVIADSPVLIGVYAFSARDGSSLTEDYLPKLITGLANPEALGKDMAQLVVGQTEGTRLLVVRPTKNGSTELDVVDILPVVANGAPADPGEGPLQVEFNDAGPKVSHTGDTPTSVTVQTLRTGDGAQVFPGDRVVLQYHMQHWTDGEVISSTWGDGIPGAIDIDTAMIGLQNALLDQRVGSRLAVTVPPDSATGDDTLVAVIDILGTEPAPS